MEKNSLFLSEFHIGILMRKIISNTRT